MFMGGGAIVICVAALGACMPQQVYNLSWTSKIYTFNVATVLGIISVTIGSFLINFPTFMEAKHRLRPNLGIENKCDLSHFPCLKRGDKNQNVYLFGTSHALHLGEFTKTVFPNKNIIQISKSACSSY